MFSWLRGQRDDVYRPRERRIWTYFNGERMVVADPQMLWSAIVAVGPSLSLDFKVAASISQDAPNAHTRVVATIRRIFKLRDMVDGFELPQEGTLTNGEACDLFDAFVIYVQKLKKNSPPTAIFAETTSPPIASSSAEGPATKPGSPSGSCATATNIASPAPSAMA